MSPKNYHKNPRKISRKRFDQLKHKLAEFGDLGGIVHDLNSDEIIGGNQRSNAFDIASCEIEIVQQFDEPDEQGTVAHGFVVWRGKRYAYRQVRWTPDQCEEANILANLAGGDWDFAELANWNASDLIEWGFDDDLMKDWKSDIVGLGALIDSEKQEPEEAPEAEVDRGEELREKWGVERGQLWIIPSKSGDGEHRLICGDCTDRKNAELLIGELMIDVVFTDPPYGVGIGDKNKFLNSFKKAGRNLSNISGDLLGKDDLFDMLVSCFSLAKDFMNDSCAVYVCSPQGGELGMMMMMMMMMSGFPVRHVLNWVKNAPTFSLGRLDYDYQHEPILYTWNKKHVHRGVGDHKTSTWFVDKPRSSKEHPTMKPAELYINAYLNSSDEGCIAYEPFCGSGTAVVACEQTGRFCRAIEIEPKYVAVTLERLAAMGLEPYLSEEN